MRAITNLAALGALVAWLPSAALAESKVDQIVQDAGASFGMAPEALKMDAEAAPKIEQAGFIPGGPEYLQCLMKADCRRKLLRLWAAEEAKTLQVAGEDKGFIVGGDGGKPAQDIIDDDNGKVRIAGFIPGGPEYLRCLMAPDCRRRLLFGAATEAEEIQIAGFIVGGEGGKPAQDIIDDDNGKVRIAGFIPGGPEYLQCLLAPDCRRRLLFGAAESDGTIQVASR